MLWMVEKGESGRSKKITRNNIMEDWKERQWKEQRDKQKQVKLWRDKKKSVEGVKR